MLDVNTVKDDRQMKALTGLTLSEFCRLAESFRQGYQQHLDARHHAFYSPRQRRAGGGRKGKLPTIEAKLFFVLYYLKTYPTFDVLATQFAISRSKACESAHHLSQALWLTFQAIGVAPARSIDSFDTMQAVMGELKTLLVDATERPYFRSRDPDWNQLNNSGKKNAIPEKTQ
jgi:hypothetical protein